MHRGNMAMATRCLLLATIVLVASALQPWDGLIASARRWLAAAPMLRHLSGPDGVSIDKGDASRGTRHNGFMREKGTQRHSAEDNQPVYATVVRPQRLSSAPPHDGKPGVPAAPANADAAMAGWSDEQAATEPTGNTDSQETKGDSQAPQLRQSHPLSKQTWGSRGRRLGMGLVTGVEGTGGVSRLAMPTAPPEEAPVPVSALHTAEDMAGQAGLTAGQASEGLAEAAEEPFGLRQVLAGAAEDEAQHERRTGVAGRIHAQPTADSLSKDAPGIPHGTPAESFATHEFPTADKLLADSMSAYLEDHPGDAEALYSAAAAAPRIATAVFTTLQQSEGGKRPTRSER